MPVLAIASAGYTRTPMLPSRPHVPQHSRDPRDDRRLVSTSTTRRPATHWPWKFAKLLRGQDRRKRPRDFSPSRQAGDRDCAKTCGL